MAFAPASLILANNYLPLSGALYVQQGLELMSKSPNKKPWNIEFNNFCMLMHLSQLSGLMLPGLGFFMPIIMWATTKAEVEGVDIHGRAILNWMLSFVIYFIIILWFAGIFGALALVFYNFVFIIIGAVQASKGEVWRYPLSIPFFSGVKYI